MASELGTIVVTGGMGALGGAVLADLLEQGAHVAALDAPRSAAALAALEVVHPGKALGVVADVTSPGEWTAALGAIEARLGAPTGAVLIAGGWRGGAPHHESDEATWQAMLSANLETTQRSLAALLPGMVARKRGSIVLIGSRAAVRPWESANAAAYAASKAAVVALAQAVAAEVLEAGVRVNVVMPSTIDTAANRASMPNVDPAKWVAKESLAGVIRFLLSDAARDVSGAAVPVYGRA